jgi:cyclic di-GMP phosphodiesterase Gmr
MLKLIAGPADYVARMGGDEFAVVLKNRPPSDIPSIISHIQSTVEEIGETFCGDRLLSASIGSASMPRDGGDAEQLLGKADRRMYGVKQSHHAQPRRAMGLERVLPALQAEAGVTIH